MVRSQILKAMFTGWFCILWQFTGLDSQFLTLIILIIKIHLTLQLAIPIAATSILACRSEFFMNMQLPAIWATKMTWVPHRAEAHTLGRACLVLPTPLSPRQDWCTYNFQGLLRSENSSNSSSTISSTWY